MTKPFKSEKLHTAFMSRQGKIHSGHPDVIWMCWNKLADRWQYQRHHTGQECNIRCGWVRIEPVGKGGL